MVGFREEHVVRPVIAEKLPAARVLDEPSLPMEFLTLL